MRKFRIVLIACLAFSLHAQSQDITTTSQMERQIFDWTNQERAKVHAPELKWDEHLALAARLHSDEMAKAKDLSHQVKGEPVFTERLVDRGARFSAAAENVGFADDAETLHSGWMHSPPHRANLLNPAYTEMGVGIVRSGDRLWATEDFSIALGRLSSEDFETGVEQQITLRRSARGLAPLKATASPELRRIACSGDNAGGAGMGAVPHNNMQAWSFNFTAPKPDLIPSQVTTRFLELPTGAYSIGACASQPDKNGLSTYRVLLVLYR
jgi:hypothetical protein